MITKDDWKHKDHKGDTKELYTSSMKQYTIQLFEYLLNIFSEMYYINKY